MAYIKDALSKMTDNNKLSNEARTEESKHVPETDNRVVIIAYDVKTEEINIDVNMEIDQVLLLQMLETAALVVRESIHGAAKNMDGKNKMYN